MLIKLKLLYSGRGGGRGGELSRNENWTFAGGEIEIVNSFNYLGMVLSSGGHSIRQQAL